VRACPGESATECSCALMSVICMPEPYEHAPYCTPPPEVVPQVTQEEIRRTDSLLRVSSVWATPFGSRPSLCTEGSRPRMPIGATYARSRRAAEAAMRFGGWASPRTNWPLTIRALRGSIACQRRAVERGDGELADAEADVEPAARERSPSVRVAHVAIACKSSSSAGVNSSLAPGSKLECHQELDLVEAEDTGLGPSRVAT
jgi:hypothetical protein